MKVRIGEDKIIKFPYSFLRDSCESNFHPSTGQRVNAMRKNILDSRPSRLTVLTAGEGENSASKYEPHEAILEIEWEIKN